MSIIKSSQSPPQPASAGDVSRHQTRENEHLSKRDVKTILVAAGGGLSALFLIAWLLLPLSAKILPFVLVSAWPLLTLIVVAYQAVVYRRQWNAMQDALEQTDRVIDKMQAQWEIMNEQLQLEHSKTNPRLQITDVRAVNLKLDESPIFLLSIRNVGALDAEDALIDLRVSFGRSVDPEGTMAQKLTAPQTVTIPTGQEHIYAIPWDGPITEEYIKRLRKVRVSGFIQLKGEDARKFCYRYYAIKGDRPQGMPEFVPCDFDTRLTKIVTAGSARLKVEPFPPNVITTDNNPDEDENDDDKEANPN